MQYNFKLGRVVTFGFGSVFVVMVVIGIVSKLTTNKLVESNGWVSHTYQVEGHLENISKLLVDAETGQRGFILTQKANYLQPYNTSVANFEKIFDEVNKLIQDNPEQVTRLNQIKQLAKDKMGELTETIDLTQQGKRQEAMTIILSNKGKQIMDEIRSKLAEMTQVEDRLLADRQQIAKQTAFMADLVSLGGTTIAILFGSFVLFFIAREIVRPIMQVANAIASSSNEIASTVEQQERTANQQATSVSETTTTMDELSASAQQSAQQAATASTSAEQGAAMTKQTVEVFSNVTDAVNRMVLNIQQISLNANQQAMAVQQILQAMNALNSSARETASGISQTRVSTHQLNDAASKLQSVV